MVVHKYLECFLCYNDCKVNKLISKEFLSLLMSILYGSNIVPDINYETSRDILVFNFNCILIWSKGIFCLVSNRS